MPHPLLLLPLLVVTAPQKPQKPTKPTRPPKVVLTPNQIHQKFRDSVVGIVTEVEKGTGSGTGFFFEDDRTIVTCYHVVEGAKSIQVQAGGELPWTPVRVIANKRADLAILKLAAGSGRTPFTAAPFRGGGIGMPLTVIGNPLGLSGSLSTGVLSSYRHEEGVSLVQFTAPISNGSSGGPVIAEDGLLEGIVTSSFEEGQNLNFAIDSSEAKQMVYKPGMSLAEFIYMQAEDEAKVLTKDAARRRLSRLEGEIYSGYRLGYLRWSNSWYRDLAKPELNATLALGGLGLDVPLLAPNEYMKFDRQVLAKAAGLTPEEVEKTAIWESLIEETRRKLANARRAYKNALIDKADKADIAAKRAAVKREEDDIQVLMEKLKPEFDHEETWVERDAFDEGLDAPVKGLLVASLFAGQPNPDLPFKAVVARSLTGDKRHLLAGDVVVGIAPDAPDEVFEGVRDWRMVGDAYARMRTFNRRIKLRVLRAGQEIVLRQPQPGSF